MATSSKKSKESAATKSQRRYIGKPGGVIQERVQKSGPERFGIIAVDCAIKRSKWCLCDYYGRVIIAPTTVEHHSGCLNVMTQQIQDDCEAERIVDSIAAGKMTGVRSAISLILAGRAQKIHSQRDRKLAEARNRRSEARQAARQETVKYYTSGPAEP